MKGFTKQLAFNWKQAMLTLFELSASLLDFEDYTDLGQALS